VRAKPINAAAWQQAITIRKSNKSKSNFREPAVKTLKIPQINLGAKYLAPQFIAGFYSMNFMDDVQ
jgi:hypothetical protein